MTKPEQAFVSFVIRVLIIGILAILDFISKQLSAGAIQLPDPTITVPLLGLIVSEADTWLINWQGNQTP